MSVIHLLPRHNPTFRRTNTFYGHTYAHEWIVDISEVDMHIRRLLLQKKIIDVLQTTNVHPGWSKNS